MATNKLYYYRACGRANQIRLALAAGGIDWEDVHPKSFPPTDEERKVWRDIGGNTTTNIPTLLLDGRVYTQSSAVLRTVARKGGLMPVSGDEYDLYLVDKIIADAEDLRTLAYGTFVSWGAPQEKADDFIERGLPLHLGNFERQLNGDYFVGEKMTVADIAAYDAIVTFGSNRVTGALEGFPKLKAWAGRVEAHPKIAAYHASPKFEGLIKFDVIGKSS